MTITGDELKRIHTQVLWLTSPVPTNAGTGNFQTYVDNISSAETTTFRDMILISGGHLNFINNPSTFGSGLWAASFEDININTSLTFHQAGDLTQSTGLFPAGITGSAGFLKADYASSPSNGDGIGNLNIAAGAAVSTNNFDLWLQANDIDLQGTTNSGTGDTIILISDEGTIGLAGNTVDTSTLCGGGACGMTLINSELTRITANKLVIGKDRFETELWSTLNGDIWVNRVNTGPGNFSSFEMSALLDKARIHFVGSTSTFPGLVAEADNGINVGTDIRWSSTGDTFFNADADGQDDGSLIEDDALRFTRPAEQRVSSGGNMTLSAESGDIWSENIILLSSRGMTINDSFTGPTRIWLNADDQDLGVGILTISPGVTVSMVGNNTPSFLNHIAIIAADIDLQGNLFTIGLNPDQDEVTITVNSNTLGLAGTGVDADTLCGEDSCGMTLTGDEMQRISTRSLVFFQSTTSNLDNPDSKIFIDNISTADTSSFGSVFMYTGGSVHFVNNPSTFNSTLFAGAFGDININVNLSVVSGGELQGFFFGVDPQQGLLLAADSNFFDAAGAFLPLGHGNGDIHIAAGATVSTNNFDLWLLGNDIQLQGTTNSGTANTYLMVSDQGTVGLAGPGVDTTTLCGGFSCGMTLDNSETQNITASELVIGQDPFNSFMSSVNGYLWVNNTTSTQFANIGSVSLNALLAGASIHFDSATSIFPALTTEAANSINVDVDLTTTVNDLTLNGNEGVVFTGLRTLTSAGGLTLSAATNGISADSNMSLRVDGEIRIMDPFIFSGGFLAISPNTPGTMISLGDALGGMHLSTASLGNITSNGTVTVSGRGAIVVDNAIVTNINRFQLSSIQSSITFTGRPSSFNSIEALANNGLTVRADISTTVGDLVLDGDSNGNFDGEDVLSFIDNRVLTSRGNLVLRAATGKIRHSSLQAELGLTLEAVGMIELRDDFSSTTRGLLALNGGDVALFGTLSAPAASHVSISTSLTGETIGLTGETLLPNTASSICKALCGMTLTAEELGRITTNNLRIGGNDSGNLFVDGVDVTGVGRVELSATNAGAGITFSGTQSIFETLAANAANGINVEVDLTTTGVLTINSDSDADGLGDFIVASSKTVSTTGNNLSIIANDLILDGSLDSGIGTTSIDVSDGGTIEVGLFSGDMTIDLDEIARIQAGTLIIGGNVFNGNIVIDGYDGTGLGLKILSGFRFTFQGAASVFDSLEVQADNGIVVAANLTTITGDLVLNGDFNNPTTEGMEGIIISDGITLTSAANMILNAGTGSINTGSDVTLETSGLLSVLNDVTAGGKLELLNSDLALFGGISVPSGDNVYISNPDGGTIGLTGELLAPDASSSICGGVACGLTITNEELRRISTTGFVIIGIDVPPISSDKFGGSIFVDRIDGTGINLGLNALRPDGEITFSGTPLTFESLSVSAANGINVNVNLISNAGLSLNGDSDSSVNPSGSGITRFADGVTLSGNTILLKSLTVDMIAEGDLTLLANTFVNIDEGNLEVLGHLQVDSGISNFSVGFAGGAPTVTAANMDIVAGDVVLWGQLQTLDPVNGVISITLSQSGGSIGMDGGLFFPIDRAGGSTSCGGTSCDLSLSGGELQNITAGKLILGGDATGFVLASDITSTHSQNIGSIELKALRTGGQIELNNVIFNTLLAESNNGMTVSGLVTTVAGDLVLTAGAGNLSGVGDVTLEAEGR